MLIREKLEGYDFSNSERAIVDFILEKRLEIRDMTTKEIAQGAYASPSTLVRIVRKMDFGGWNELKEALLREEEYLQSHFQAIDDTHSLITHDELQKAILHMRKASSIGLYAVSNNLILAREFQHNMNRIGKKVELCQLQERLSIRLTWQREPPAPLSYPTPGKLRF